MLCSTTLDPADRIMAQARRCLEPVFLGDTARCPVVAVRAAALQIADSTSPANPPTRNLTEVLRWSAIAGDRLDSARPRSISLLGCLAGLGWR